MGELTQETKDQIRQLLLDPESLDAVTDFYAICGRQNLVRDTAEFNVAVSRAVELFHTMNCLHRAFAWAKLVCYREILIEMHPKIAKTMVAALMCDEAITRTNEPIGLDVTWLEHSTNFIEPRNMRTIQRIPC